MKNNDALSDETIRFFDLYDQILLFLIHGIKPVGTELHGRIVKWKFKHGDVKEIEEKFNNNATIPIPDYRSVIAANAVWKSVIATRNSMESVLK